MKKLGLFQKLLLKVTGIDKKLTEAVSSTSQDELTWRRLTSSDAKGLSIVARDRQLDIVFKLFLTNGLAKRTLEIQNDHVCGDGFSYKVSFKEGFGSEDKIQQVMDLFDEFWTLNKMNLRYEKKVFDLSLNGTLILPVFINEVNGSVRLGFVDPKNIDRIITNPLDIEEIQSIQFKGDLKGIMQLKVINPNYDNPSDDNYGLLDGETFYYAINNVTNQPEGVSDLLAAADWIDVLDQMIFGVLENVKAQNLFVQDVLLKGANETQISEWEEKNQFPTKPTRVVHNEEMEQKLMSTQIQGKENNEIIRTIKNYSLATFGYPEHWFADGGQTNLATATEQDRPVMRKMKKRQQLISFMLQDILHFVAHKAYKKRQGFTLTRDDLMNMSIDIILPDFATKEIGTIVDGIKTLTDALVVAEEKGFISHKTACQIFRASLDTIGHEVDNENEDAQIQKEEKTNLKTKNNKDNGKEEKEVNGNNNPEGDNPETNK
jgi:hypothetical protein